MAKLKTNKSVSKRMWRTGKGKFKRSRAAKGHLLTHKTQKRKRHLRKAALVSKSEVAKVRRMLPYG